MAAGPRQKSSVLRKPTEMRDSRRDEQTAMPKSISSDEYEIAFGIRANDDKRKAALEHALDIRKFEIQLYWTRAAYFWAFIGAALAAYGAIQTITDGRTRSDLSVIVSCVGIVFSFAWYCVNRGSKQWQENWENHVDLLEDAITGPLYKTVLRRARPTTMERVKRVFNGPAAFSVSKINQLISIYITAIWVLLLVHVLPPISGKAHISGLYTACISISTVTCVMIATIGRTHDKDYGSEATMRRAMLKTELTESTLASTPPRP